MSTEISILSTLSTHEEKDILPMEEWDCFTKDNLPRTIVDLSFPLETRIEAINLYLQQRGNDDTIETVNKLGTMYELSGTKTLRQYLFAICEKSVLPALLKSIAALSLYTHDSKDDLGYKAIDIVYPQLGSEVGTPYKIDFVKVLMCNETYKEKARNYFCNIIDDTIIDCNYRYKAILSLENKDLTYFIQESCLTFIQNEKNLINLRILAGQNLLQKNKERMFVQNILQEIATNEENDYNVRADATDVLLQLGDEHAKKLAQDVIMKLGVGTKKIHTIYSNAQNVHTKEIEDSIKNALEFLQGFSILKVQGKNINIDYVEEKVIEITKQLSIDDKDKEKISISLNRIRMDRALYSQYSCTLEHILLRVWSYLVGHDHEKEMKKRLVEELIEMSGTCSSGFATRLVNTISGFGDFSMRISWREQIIGNFTGRLNARIRDMDNLTIRDKVLSEMTAENFNYDSRKNFLKFLRKNILSIRNELYEEFKIHMDDTDFDLHFRAAVSMYETGHFK